MATVIANPELCPLCQSKKLWLPRKSTKWRCWDCQKPSTPAIIAEKNFEEVEPHEDPTLAGCSWERYLVLPGYICDCKSRIVLEVSTPDSMKWICWSCKKPVLRPTVYGIKLEQPPEPFIRSMTKPIPGVPRIEYAKTGFTMEMLKNLTDEPDSKSKPKSKSAKQEPVF